MRGKALIVVVHMMDRNSHASVVSLAHNFSFIFFVVDGSLTCCYGLKPPRSYCARDIFFSTFQRFECTVALNNSWRYVSKRKFKKKINAPDFWHSKSVASSEEKTGI